MNLENSLKGLFEEGKLIKQKTNIGYLNNLINSAKRKIDEPPLKAPLRGIRGWEMSLTY